jgi:CRISPR/Cas system CSM-associated protein Csm3 (group 7 of RAMP superfamily)
MGNPIVKRYCILIKGRLASPLRVGSGQGEQTDSDVLCDADGHPFVPGSSLAGAFRHYLGEIYTGKEEQEAIRGLFGPRLRDVGLKSRLICHPMTFEGAVVVSKRDGVRLDAYKTAEPEAKYDMQIVERGAPFQLRLEWVIRSANTESEAMEEALICALIDGLALGKLTVGAKGRRGFGELAVTGVGVDKFDHRNREDSRRWLDWDWGEIEQSCDKWEPGKSALIGKHRTVDLSGRRTGEDYELCVPLKIKHTIMIRHYATDPESEDLDADYVQLKSVVARDGSPGPSDPNAEDGQSKDEANKKTYPQYPVIPGTSWAGAIRHHLAALLEDLGVKEQDANKKLEKLFGPLQDNRDVNRPESSASALWASYLRFAESVIEGGWDLPTTRTAVDRFTGSARTGALYTSRPWVGGTTKLRVRWRHDPGKDDDLSPDVVCGLMIWVIRDLEEGLLAVGGETAIGRGLLESEGKIELNGKPLESDAHFCRKALEWCLKPLQEDAREVCVP